MLRKQFLAMMCVAALGFLVAADARGQVGDFSSVGGLTDQVQAGPGCRIDFGTTPDCAGRVETISGTPLNVQFACQGIVFGAAVDSGRPATQFQTDSACPSPDGNMHSSGSPPFATDWWAQFVVDGVQAKVTTFSVDVCFIDSTPPTVLLEGYNNEKQVIVTASSTVNGSETLTISHPDGIGYVRVVSSADPAGLSIDCLSFPDPDPKGPIIPAVSEWGLVMLVILGLGVGTIVFRRRAEWETA